MKSESTVGIAREEDQTAMLNMRWTHSLLSLDRAAFSKSHSFGLT
jgi:hypothetical protein